MNWDALTAVSTAASALVVLVAGAVAVYQLREGRRASQFDATQRMVDRIIDPRFNRAVRYVLDELPKRMEDPEYRGELERARGWDIDPDRHPEVVVLARLEEVGIYLRHRLLLGDALLDFNGQLILQAWGPLKPVVDLQRKAYNYPELWSSAEYLYERAKAVNPPRQTLSS